MRVLDCGCSHADADSVVAALRDGGWRVSIDRVERAADVVRRLRGRMCDLALVDAGAMGFRTERIVRAVRIAAPAAAAVVVSVPPDASRIAALVRAGAQDVVTASDGPVCGEPCGRIAALGARSVSARLAQERLAVLESACRRLSKERAALEAQVMQMASGLASAEHEAVEREARASMASEFRTLVAQETDIESVISLGGHYLVARMGATNAALFVMDHDRWRLGGYVRDDLARRAAGGLLDHLADVWCTRIAAQADAVRVSPSEPVPQGWGGLAGLLPGRQVLAFACRSAAAHGVSQAAPASALIAPQLQPASAVVVLFREVTRPFGPECLRTADALAPALGAAIDRVRRVLSRARPSWPAEPPGEARGQD